MICLHFCKRITKLNKKSAEIKLLTIVLAGPSSRTAQTHGAQHGCLAGFNILINKVLKVVTTRAALRSALDNCRNNGEKIGFVPTMGALHQGHIALVKRAKAENTIAVASVFVNPTQFNDKNDLKHYPRTPEADTALLEAGGCDYVFMPDAAEMYPDGEAFVPEINWGVLDKVMEGAHRPGHFKGVVQIVSRLFEATGPCTAYFGQKDFQQLAVIRRMTHDLQLPVTIVGCPTVREADGLAMSSRNVRLTPAERAVAPLLAAALQQAKKMWPDNDAATVTKVVAEMLEAEPMIRPDYFEIVDADTLLPVAAGQKKNAVACIAAYLGAVRLIDNMMLS